MSTPFRDHLSVRSDVRPDSGDAGGAEGEGQAAAVTTAEIADSKNVRPSSPERMAVRVSGPKQA